LSFVIGACIIRAVGRCLQSMKRRRGVPSPIAE